MLELVVDIRGIDDMLRNLEATKQDSIKVRALREAGQILKTEIEANAPESAIPPTAESDALPQGALKNDVVMTVSKSNHSVVVGFGKYTKHVARWLEFGFHHIRKGKFVNIRSGFFRRAIEAALPQAQTTLQNSLLTNIQKAFKTGRTDRNAA
jgi:hypothetical protein